MDESATLTRAIFAAQSTDALRLNYNSLIRYAVPRNNLTAVGFEPTPLRTGALSQRLRPLGQTVLIRRLRLCNKVRNCLDLIAGTENHAPCEARTHDLRIMRPTRYLLRQRGSRYFRVHVTLDHIEGT